MSTLKLNIRLGLVLLTGLSMVFVFIAMVKTTPVTAQTSCVQKTIVGESGFITATWTTAPSGQPCVEMILQESGDLQITGGWVFTAPVSMDGLPIPVAFVEGQLAPQIQPTMFTQLSQGAHQISLTWLESGTEIGFWWNFFPQTPPPTATTTPIPTEEPGNVITKELSLGSSTTTITKWTGTGIGTLITTFPVAGHITVERGWTFDPDALLNGQPLTMHIQQGELALQIDAFSKDVQAGDSWEWTQNLNGTGELGLVYSYSASSLNPTPSPSPTVTPPVSDTFKVYLPLVIQPVIPTNFSADVSKSDVYIAHFNGQPNTPSCFILNFKMTGSANIDSGWFFGTGLTATVNGSPVDIKFHISPGELAYQIDKLQLTAPKQVEICSTNATEIGLRVIYPAP